MFEIKNSKKVLAGFAYGKLNYMCKCVDCKEQFFGAKGSYRCFDCAVEVYDEYVENLTKRIAELEESVTTDSENLKRRNKSLSLENKKLLDHNKKFHRRIQKIEGPMQSKIDRLQNLVDMYRRSHQHSFNRVINAHQQLKKCYVVAAKALGLPHKSFHSVMDLKGGCGPEATETHSVWANVFVADGIEAYDVAETVEKAINKVSKQNTRR